MPRPCDDIWVLRVHAPSRLRGTVSKRGSQGSGIHGGETNASEVVGADTSSDRTSPFHDAVERGDTQAVKHALLLSPFLANSGDPGRANTTPLHLASRRGFLDLAALLLQAGADVNARGAWRLTPLHYAAVFDHPHIAAHLLEAGADATLLDARGTSALEHARMEGNSRVEAMLLRHQEQQGTAADPEQSGTKRQS